TFVTYHVSKGFYRDVDKALTILENPFVWRPLVEGYADGVTFSGSMVRALWLLPKAVVLRRFRYRRIGVSRPFGLSGPVRGLPYVFEPTLRRVQRWLRGRWRSLLRVADAPVEGR